MVVDIPMHTLHHKLLEIFDGKGLWHIALGLYGRTYNDPRPPAEKNSQTIWKLIEIMKLLWYYETMK